MILGQLWQQVIAFVAGLLMVVMPGAQPPATSPLISQPSPEKDKTFATAVSSEPFTKPNATTNWTAAFPWISWEDAAEFPTLTPPILTYTEVGGIMYAQGVFDSASSTPIIGADPATFVLSTINAGGYVKDKSHVYYIYVAGDAYAGGVMVQTIDGADANTFDVLSYNVPYSNSPGPEAEEGYATDDNHVYGCGYSDQGQGDLYQCGVIPGADPATFRVFSVVQDQNSSAQYDAEDENHEYFNGQVVQ